MKYEILRREIDVAGRTRCWVDFGNDKIEILKFEGSPTKDKIRTQVDNFWISREKVKWEELNRVVEEITRLEEKKRELEELETR